MTGTPLRVVSNHPGRRREAHAPRGNAGFSIVELLIIVAVAIVLTTMGVAQVLAGARMFRLQQAASTVAGKLMDARLSALKRNRPTWLAIDLATQTVQVQMNDPGGVATNIGPGATLPRGVNIIVAPAQIDYDSLGRLAAAQVITLSDGAGNARAVTVSVTGTTSVTAVDID